LSFGGRDFELHGAPRLALVGELDVHPHRVGIANELGFSALKLKTSPFLGERTVQCVKHVFGAVAERRVVVLGGARVDPEPQLHRRAALEREQRLAILVTDPVEHGADDVGVDPALVAAGRHARVGGRSVGQALEVRQVAGRLARFVFHAVTVL
jgi:hypothetical protein